MVSEITLKNGEKYQMKYVYTNDHLLEIVPFQTDCFDKPSYLPDGWYDLIETGRIHVQDKKIDYIKLRDYEQQV